MKSGVSRSFGEQLKALRQAAGFTQEELATIAGLSVHAVSALERGERRRPQVETVRALTAALDLTGPTRDALVGSARPSPDTGDAADTRPVPAIGAALLPLAPTPLLGRDADMRTLRQWLADPTMRLITLLGPGGVGKTRLAIELAHAVAADTFGRVVFVPLAPAGNASFVASAIAEALGLADASPINVANRARAACDGRSTLLVLDNFEHVLDAAPLVADLLTTIAPLRIVVTSRAVLHVRGEREFVVNPLALEADADAPASEESTGAPAVRLFVERVRDAQPDFQLTAANSATVSAICRRLDALPLALELAAPWMKVLAADDLLRRLTPDVLLSTVGPRDLPERQQTMNATVAWSYQLLSADEQRAFRRFGALPGTFPIDAAAAVLAGRESASGNDEALTAAASLIDKSLLVRVEGSVIPTCPLYQMLETVRAYAALELNAAGEFDAAMEGLARYTIAESTLAADGLIGLAQIEWLDRVREDLDSYRGALTWLIGRDRANEAAGIAWSLLFFWVIRGHAAEGLRWFEQILTLRSLSAKSKSEALVGVGVLAYTQGDLDRSRKAMLEALALALERNDANIAAQADNLLGHVEHAAGNMDQSRERFSQSIARFRGLSVPWGAGHAASGLAWVALAVGDVAGAERLLDESVAGLQQAGPWFLQLGIYLRAVLAVRRGDPDAAIALVGDSLLSIRQLHDKFAFVYALVPLAAAAALKGDDAWAARILGARDAVTERTGSAFVDKSVQDLRDEAERGARSRLGTRRWAEAYSAGRASSIDSLLRDVEIVRQRQPAR